MSADRSQRQRVVVPGCLLLEVLKDLNDVLAAVLVVGWVAVLFFLRRLRANLWTSTRQFEKFRNEELALLCWKLALFGTVEALKQLYKALRRQGLGVLGLRKVHHGCRSRWGDRSVLVGKW